MVTSWERNDAPQPVSLPTAIRSIPRILHKYGMRDRDLNH